MEGLKVIFLTDLEEVNVDGVILATESNAKDVQEAINKVKEEIELYTWEDIEEGLPDDCKLYWNKNNEEVYY